MRLYIGNATRHVHEFNYKPIDRPDPRRQTIEPHCQIQIAGDLSYEEIEYIVGQHRKYGIVEASAIDRHRGYGGLCYSVDKPIDNMRLTYLFDNNIQELVRQGERTRAETAVGQNLVMQSRLGRPMDATDVEIEQDAGGGDPTVEHVHVSRTDDPTPTHRRYRGRRKIGA